MELGLNRRNIGRLVLLAWAVMLAWLARREFTRGEDSARSQQIARLAPAAQYFAVYAAGRQIGQFNLTVDTLIDGVRIAELFVLDVPQGGGTHQLTRGSEFTLSRSLRIRRLSHSVVGVGPQERLDAEVGADSVLRVVSSEAPQGVAGRSRISIHPDQVLPVTLPYRVAYSGRLRVGAEFSLSLVDLQGSGTGPVAVRVTAESTFVVPDSAVWDSAGRNFVTATTDTIRAWRIEHDATGAPTVSWVDAGGVLVHQEIGGGVTLHRSAFEIVRNNYRELRRTEPQAWRRTIPGMRSLGSSGRIPETSASSRAFVVIADSGSPVWRGTLALDGGRQRVYGDTVVISRVAPADSGSRPPWLETTWDLPVEDDEVEAAAVAALAGATSPEDSIGRLTRWVARQIRTDTGSTASATAVFTLRAGRGGAEGKARLLAAMGRAAGIPSRVVSGLALLPDGSYGHAWAELWAGRWISADPSFGQVPASASLLRLAVGGRSRPIDLVLLAGSARFLPIRTPR